MWTVLFFGQPLHCAMYFYFIIISSSKEFILPVKGVRGNLRTEHELGLKVINLTFTTTATKDYCNLQVSKYCKYLKVIVSLPCHCCWH